MPEIESFECPSCGIPMTRVEKGWTCLNADCFLQFIQSKVADKLQRLSQLEQENEDLRSALSSALACGVDHGCQDCAETYAAYFPDNTDIDLSVVGETFDLRISEYREFSKLAVPIVKFTEHYFDGLDQVVKRKNSLSRQCTACLAALPKKEKDENA